MRGKLRQKAKTSPLQEKDYCDIRQHKVDRHGSKLSIRDFKWIGPNVVENILPNENYIVRNVNTNENQFF